jgi:hypothetical protein
MDDRIIAVGLLKKADIFSRYLPFHSQSTAKANWEILIKKRDHGMDTIIKRRIQKNSLEYHSSLNLYLLLRII